MPPKQKDFFQKNHKKRTSARALGALWIRREEVERNRSGRAEVDNHGAVAAETARRDKEADTKAPSNTDAQSNSEK